MQSMQFNERSIYKNKMSILGRERGLRQLQENLISSKVMKIQPFYPNCITTGFISKNGFFYTTCMEIIPHCCICCPMWGFIYRLWLQILSCYLRLGVAEYPHVLWNLVNLDVLHFQWWTCLCHIWLTRNSHIHVFRVTLEKSFYGKCLARVLGSRVFV